MTGLGIFMAVRKSIDRLEDRLPPAPIKEVSYIPEQQAIIQSDEPSLKVLAGAGAGKSTTLFGYSCARPDESMLYLCFNRAIREEASKKFPKNVLCRTTNAIAYRAMDVKNRYESNGRRLAGSLKPFDLSKPLDAGYTDAACAIRIINQFTCGADDVISEQHAIDAGVNPSLRGISTYIAKEAWEMMTTGRTQKGYHIPMTHDGYLKMFQLSGRSFGNFSTILFDEAQDANLVTTKMVMGSNARKIFVGDRHQSIYAFRGAKNAMDMMVNMPEYTLSSSFRFGPQIAAAANVILKNALGENKMQLKGLGGASKVSNFRNAQYEKGAVANLTRTNGAIIEMAIQSMKQGVSFHVIGGMETLKLDLAMDVYKLATNQKNQIVNSQIKQFNNFDEFLQLSEDSEDPEFNSLGKLVKKFGKNIPFVIESLRNANSATMEGVKEIYCTAHKSKGLEFDAVKLHDDFIKLNESDEEEGVAIQEANLIYVAMTRAKNALYLPPDMMDYLHNPKVNRAIDRSDRGIGSKIITDASGIKSKGFKP